jgi:hypothetical protein
VTRCTCTPTHDCAYCLDRIDAAEEARAGRYRGWSQADLDAAADGQAARCYGGY